MLLVLAASFPILFAFGARPAIATVTVSWVTLLGIVWIGIPLVHAVLLRDLPSHGAALLVDVLVGTFVADTAAYATGACSAVTRSRQPPPTRPSRPDRRLLIGTMGFWFAGLYQDWLSAPTP